MVLDLEQKGPLRLAWPAHLVQYKGHCRTRKLQSGAQADTAKRLFVRRSV